MSIISSVLSVAEGFVAWFLSWAIWNPQFTLASLKNMWNTEKQAFLNIVLFFRGLVEENGVSNITIPIAIAGMITMAVVLTIFIVGCNCPRSNIIIFLVAVWLYSYGYSCVLASKSKWKEVSQAYYLGVC